MKAATRGLATLPAAETPCRTHTTRCHEGSEVRGPKQTSQHVEEMAAASILHTPNSIGERGAYPKCRADHHWSRAGGLGGPPILLFAYQTTPAMCFRSCYTYIQNWYSQRRRAWPSVLRELKQAASLLTFAYVQLGTPWSPEVLVSDASFHRLCRAPWRLD